MTPPGDGPQAVDPFASDRPSARAVRQLPEPARFWIAAAPRSWRCAEAPWTQLASGTLAGFRDKGAALPSFDASDLDDLLYLPPVAPALQRERDLLAAGLAEAGTPVLVQLRPGETCGAAQVRVVYDLLDPLLSGEIERFTTLPSGAVAAWPMVPGISDNEEIWEEGLLLLRSVGVTCVQPVIVDIAPRDRRVLAEGREDHVFDALFHGSQPSERAFVREAVRLGLAFQVERRPTGRSHRVESNRRIAAELAWAGELWLRLGRTVSGGQALFRAARGAESTSQDLVALARENNLVVMGWLDANSLHVVREIVEEGRASLLQELLEDYVGQAVPLPGTVLEEEAADEPSNTESPEDAELDEEFEEPSDDDV